MNECIERYQRDVAELGTAGQDAGSALDSLDEYEEDERRALSAACSGEHDVSGGREESEQRDVNKAAEDNPRSKEDKEGDPQSIGAQ